MRRRGLVFAPLCAALAAAVPASAGLMPINRTFGEVTVPTVKPGTIRIPAGHAHGRVTVIVRLQLPPLAAEAGRGLAAVAGKRRLNADSSSSHAYLARVRAAQARTVAALHRAIPNAKVGRRFSVLLDGLTVTLRPGELPKLTSLPSVTRLYATVTYLLATNRSPGVIGADVLQHVTGADGTGVKIAVVDDGVDQTNRYFNPAGYSYPPGFPKGGTRWTTPKVIVAKTFPGPNSGRPGRLAVDPAASFHGTHVAGIAAGDAGTTAPAGPDHPTTAGLTGVAPKAWIGNYRVFTVPTPVGHTANSPEIIAAFEAAVTDGMDVINFSGGGPQADPANDPLVETVRNVVAAGVVPVIAAGNDRDDVGLGSVGSPGTAPDAITVAAVSNEHVFAQPLNVTAPNAPATVKGIPFRGAAGANPPPGWTTQDQTLVDAGAITGTDGKPVDRHLCGAGADLSSTTGTLPPRSLDGAIVLAQRGLCPFVTKSLQAQAAGAVGLILTDNRAGEANVIPLRLAVPAAMIANQDGDRLRAFMAGTGGRTTIRIGQQIEELNTGRSGIVTSFSSAGPTAFGHDLKPDLSAPGGSVLSSTLPQFVPSGFAVFDGTSMATPHVAGSAALLVELHPSWTPQQIKSALVSTAAPAWGDTARTQEAPVPLEGGGLVWLPSANDPRIFTDPSSLSFEYIDVTGGAQARGRLVRLTDAGGGSGTWTATLAPQSATGGTTLDFPGVLTISPGGESEFPVVVHAAADAQPGDDYGFIVLRQGSVTRRIPYAFKVERPALEQVPAMPLRKVVVGSTDTGPDRVERYQYPAAPFGNPPDQVPMTEDGSEKLYVLHINRPVVNAGVSVVLETSGTRIDPWFLGSKDENDVQGQAGTPINVNDLMFDFSLPVGAAGTVMPRQQAFYVSVDSGRAQFTNRRLAGRYILRSWVNDVTPPSFHVITTRLSAGRPLIVARTFDQGSGVDPLSLVVAYNRVLVGAAAYDPISGIAVYALTAAPKLTAGSTLAIFESSDYQETKNVETISKNIMPNTTFRRTRIHVVAGPAVSWINPPPEVCVAKSTRLLVTASASHGISSVRLTEHGKRVGGHVAGAAGLFAADWNTAKAATGRHALTATATDKRGARFSATRTFRVCR